jgi:hypothetical protein
MKFISPFNQAFFLSTPLHDSVIGFIVIEPNGLGEGQPSVGFGFRMAERYAGIPNDTLSRWVLDLDGNKSLQAPSGKTFRVLDILASDNNTYSVVEASDWFAALHTQDF